MTDLAFKTLSPGCVCKCVYVCVRACVRVYVCVDLFALLDVIRLGATAVSSYRTPECGFRMRHSVS